MIATKLENNGNRMRRTARVRLLEAANDLFYRRGIRGVGVDEVVRQAGVAKVSLYRAFPSKDDLIVTYLKNRDDSFWRQWNGVVEAAPGAIEALDGIIEFLASTVEHPEYRGCPFANFAAEFPQRDHAGRQVVERSKQEMRDRLQALINQFGQPSAVGLADTLLLLVEGAFSFSQTASDGQQLASRSLRQGARILLATLRTE